MLAVAVGARSVRVPVALDRVRQLARGVLRAEGVEDAMVSIAFVSPRAIARLNRAHLGHRGATDVLAFSFARRATRRRGRPGRASRAACAPNGVLGDVYIAPAVARSNAVHWGVGIREEVARLVIHGVLHVIGHDHPTGPGRVDSPMWKRQEVLLRRLTQAAR